jgi:hypothetical protein
MSSRFTLTLLFCALCFNSQPASAKKEIPFSLQPTDSITGNISFRSVRVEDMRWNKYNFGMVQIGFGKHPIVMEDSLAAALARMATKMTHQSTARQEQELLIVVKALELKNGVTDLPIVSTVYLNLDWYLGDKGRYALVKITDSLYEFLSARDSYEGTCFVANYLLTESIMEIAGTAAPAAFPLTLADLRSREEQARNSFAVYNMPPRTGVYYTREQFLNNAPADTNFIHRHYGGDLALDEFFDRNEKGKRGKNLAGTAYAVYDGKKWYRPCAIADFKEMKMTGNNFFYQAILKGIRPQNYQPIAGIGYPYGILGALATTAIAGMLQNNQNSKPLPIADALYRMRLDPVTGRGQKIERLR